MIIVALEMLALCNASAADEPVTPSPYEVVWEAPSADYNSTMPLGNGEIALNAWIEPSGDLRCYIARTDAWDDSGRLVKGGAMRIKVGDGPAERTKKFRQVLTAKDGTLSARYGEGDAQVELRLWVDANRPVICVEAKTVKPSTATAMMELWRNVATELPDKTHSDVLACALFPEKTVVEPDTVISGLKERIGWYHRNIKSVGPANLAKMQGVEGFPRVEPLLHRTFGALIAASRPQRVGEGVIKAGKLEKLIVTPESRAKDILENSLPDPADKDEADTVLRRVGALIAHLKILFIKRHFCPNAEAIGNHMCDL